MAEPDKVSYYLKHKPLFDYKKTVINYVQVIKIKTWTIISYIVLSPFLNKGTRLAMLR